MIIEECKQDDTPQIRPNVRELTAYVIERAMAGAWETWGLNPPSSDVDSFFRRYIHGHPGAIRPIREALHWPQPWDRHHVGHQIKWFLGERGEAARHYQYDKRKSTRFPVISVVEEN